MKPGFVEIMGEIELEIKRDDAVFFHEGVKELGAWLPLDRIEIFRNDPIPGLVTVWMPAAMALEHGFLDEEEAA